MWDFTPLPAIARYSILAISVVALIATAIIEFLTGNNSITGYLEVATLAAIALFAWRPPIGSLGLLVVAAAAVILGMGVPYVLALALTSGLVVFACRGWLIAVYGTIMVGLAAAVEAVGQQTGSGAIVAVIAFASASGTVGFAFRRNREKVITLNADLDRLAHEAEQVVQNERDRIADELHNIIAHDLTIVVMHTRALKLLDDSDEREQSEEAIMTAATQAMTDIRRMLHIVNGGWDADSTVPTESQPLLERLAILKEELESSGVAVKMSVPETLAISNSIEATLRHIASESVTNIMKHSPDCPEARIELSTTESSVTLCVWNAPGKGQSVPGMSSGYGLRRMAKRVELLRGAFSTGPCEGGWQLEAVLPRI